MQDNDRQFLLQVVAPFSQAGSDTPKPIDAGLASSATEALRAEVKTLELAAKQQLKNAELSSRATQADASA